MLFSMTHSYGFGGQGLSSSSLIQLTQVNHAYTSGDTSEFQSKNQLTTFLHLTNKFIVSPEPRASHAPGPNGHARNKLWRRFILQGLTLMTSLLTGVAIIAFIEYINKISTEEEALFFAERTEDFPMGVVFCYRYLPQMVVVGLGVGRAAVDLDVKRLGPYFQLSKPEGATSGNLIFLHYSFHFIAFVPVNAARRGCVFGIYQLFLRYSN